MRNHLWPLLATNRRLQHLLNRSRSMRSGGCSSKAFSLHLASCSRLILVERPAVHALLSIGRPVPALVLSTLTLSATLVVADLMCFGAGGKITSCTACEDGQSIISGSSNGSVHLWRVEYVTCSGGMPDKYTGLQSMSLAGTSCTFLVSKVHVSIAHKGSQVSFSALSFRQLAALGIPNLSYYSTCAGG